VAGGVVVAGYPAEQAQGGPGQGNTAKLIGPQPKRDPPRGS
jgi:hypothetical protein